MLVNLWKEMDDVVEIVNTSGDREWTIGEMLEKGDVRCGIGNTKVRFECYAIALQNHFLSVEEVRKLEGLPEHSTV